MGCAVDLYLREGGDGARDPGTWEYLGQGGARHHIVQEPNVNLPACCFFAVLSRRARRWAGLGSEARVGGFFAHSFHSTGASCAFHAN